MKDKNEKKNGMPMICINCAHYLMNDDTQIFLFFPKNCKAISQFVQY